MVARGGTCFSLSRYRHRYRQDRTRNTAQTSPSHEAHWAKPVVAALVPFRFIAEHRPRSTGAFCRSCVRHRAGVARDVDEPHRYAEGNQPISRWPLSESHLQKQLASPLSGGRAGTKRLLRRRSSKLCQVLGRLPALHDSNVITLSMNSTVTRLLSVGVVFTFSMVGCALNRTEVKSLRDPTAAGIQFDLPIDTTISALNAIPPHCGPTGNRRVRDEERRVYRIDGTITRVKRERDHDIHIVLADTTNPEDHVVVESDDPNFGKNATSPYRDRLVAARRMMDALISDSSANRLDDLKGTMVRVTGVGFFDVNHLQKGRSRSCIELHPILTIERLNAISTGQIPNAFEGRLLENVGIATGSGESSRDCSGDTCALEETRERESVTRRRPDFNPNDSRHARDNPGDACIDGRESDAALL